MTTKQKIANKEVLIILKELNLINRIPKDIIDNMEKNQNIEWDFVYNSEYELKEQKMTRQTIILFANLYYKYICENNKLEIEEMRKICKENERKVQEETKQKLAMLNPKMYIVQPNEEEVRITKYESPNFFQRIWNKIRATFNKKV